VGIDIGDGTSGEWITAVTACTSEEAGRAREHSESPGECNQRDQSDANLEDEVHDVADALP
jgi:hypothetical protein